jgi:putative endonuclease
MRIGAHGEELAAKYLRSLGWKLIARNWRGGRDRRDELDIVARDGGTLVFVEVKTRTLRPPAALPGETPPAAAGCGAYEAVDARKRRVLARAVRAYLGALPRAMPHHRFDIVEVLLPPPSAASAPPEIRHHRAIPLFSRG